MSKRKPWIVKRQDVPELDDFRRLEAAGEADSARNRALLALLAHSGLRRREASRLDCQDLHLADRPPYLMVRDGKGSKDRQVPLAQHVADDLLVFLGARRQGPVFVSRGGGRGRRGCRLSGSQVYRVVKALAARAGLPDVHPHSLRHLYATTHILAGTPLHTVSQYLGHAGIGVTKTYLHTLDTMNAVYPERQAQVLRDGPSMSDLLKGGAAQASTAP